MTAAEKEARVARAKWQEQCLRTSALLDAIREAIGVLDGLDPRVGVELLACNLAARALLEIAKERAT
jgi:hypothetical protein